MVPNNSVDWVRDSSSAFSAVTGAGGAFSGGLGTWLLHPKKMIKRKGRERCRENERGKAADEFMMSSSKELWLRGCRGRRFLFFGRPGEHGQGGIADGGRQVSPRLPQFPQGVQVAVAS